MAILVPCEKSARVSRAMSIRISLLVKAVRSRVPKLRRKNSSSKPEPSSHSAKTPEDCPAAACICFSMLFLFSLAPYGVVQENETAKNLYSAFISLRAGV